jgi:hypothetical protein
VEAVSLILAASILVATKKKVQILSLDRAPPQKPS